MPMPNRLREKIRPVVISSAQRICRNPLADGLPCRDCRYTVSLLGLSLVQVLTGEADKTERHRWCEEIRSAAMDA